MVPPPTLREPEIVTNQRQHERVAIMIPVVLLHGETEIAAETRNMSVGGMLVACAANVAFGAAVRVRMTLPTSEVDVPATVRWNRDGAIGLQFGSLRAKETWAINQLMKLAPKT